MSKHTTIDQLKKLAQRTKIEVDRVDNKITTLSSRVDNLVASGGEPNIITAVKNNGADLTVSDKAVDIGPAIASAISASGHLKRKKVTSMSDISATDADADQYIYMVPKTGSDADDLYDEYMVLDGKVEHIGNTKVDLSGKVDKVDGKGLSTYDFSSEYKSKLDSIQIATDTEVDAMLTEVFG